MNSAEQKLTQNVVQLDLTMSVPNKCRRNYSLSIAKSKMIFWIWV